MKTVILSLLLCVAFLFAAPSFSKSLYIGIDESTSNPVIADADSAKAAARYLRGQIKNNLRPGDFVHVLTFADRSSAHVVRRTIRIDRRHKAEDVAAQVERYVAGLPGKPRKGSGETNILAFLEFGRFDKGATIILLTDGVESSSTMRSKDILRGKSLPVPDADILKGSEVVMYGFGRSKDGSITPQSVKAMRKSWSDWMAAAGAKFTAIIDG